MGGQFVVKVAPTVNPTEEGLFTQTALNTGCTNVVVVSSDLIKVMLCFAVLCLDYGYN